MVTILKNLLQWGWGNTGQSCTDWLKMTSSPTVLLYYSILYVIILFLEPIYSSDHCYRLFEETEFGILVGTDPSWDRIQPYAHRAKPYDLDDNFEWCYECLKGHFPHKETDCQTNLLQTIGPAFKY